MQINLSDTAGTSGGLAVTPPEASPADRNPALVYLGRLAPSSRRTMRSALDAMSAIVVGGPTDGTEFPWPRLRYQHTAAIRSAVAERYTPAGANLHLAALRGVLRECWRLGLTAADDYERAADLAPVRGERLPRGRALDAGELRALFRSCAADRSPAGARDAAILAVLYGAGLRRAEIVALDLADFDPSTGAIRVRRGKGNRERLDYATNGALRALDAWVEVRGTDPGPLFVPVSQVGVVAIRAMTTQAVYKILQKRGREAGVDHFSPHDLRRSFVSDLLDAGAHVAVVARLAGHASVTTTTRYDRRPEAAKQRAAELLHVPYAPWRGGR